MKHIRIHISKSSFLAILFFGIMTTIGCNAANAQDTINPLISTTGPNVLGSGRIQWNSNLEWFHIYHQSFLKMRTNTLGANTEVRFGVGSKAELTVGFGANHTFYDRRYLHFTNTEQPIKTDPNNILVAPSVGVKILLFEGKGWLPQVAFHTNIALASNSNTTYFPKNYTAVQPTLGLRFRNQLGKRWMLDYSLDMTWNKLYPIESFEGLSGSIYARWLATDRLMLGAGFRCGFSGDWSEPFRGDFEVRYLANPNLQLTLQGGFSGGYELATEFGTIQAHLLTGVSWTIR